MKLGTQRRQLPVVLKAGATYFALVFGAGFILGPIRILCIVPRFGVRIAELMEAPLMLVVIILAANGWFANFRSQPQSVISLTLFLSILRLMVRTFTDLPRSGKRSSGCVRIRWSALKWMN